MFVHSDACTLLQYTRVPRGVRACVRACVRVKCAGSQLSGIVSPASARRLHVDTALHRAAQTPTAALTAANSHHAYRALPVSATLVARTAGQGAEPRGETARAAQLRRTTQHGSADVPAPLGRVLPAAPMRPLPSGRAGGAATGEQLAFPGEDTGAQPCRDAAALPGGGLRTNSKRVQTQLSSRGGRRGEGRDPLLSSPSHRRRSSKQRPYLRNRRQWRSQRAPLCAPLRGSARRRPAAR